MGCTHAPVFARLLALRASIVTSSHYIHTHAHTSASARPVDEIIRQVTINCAERGILLLRVRDEIRTTMHAYQTLYESSIAFGMRKALTAEQHKSEMQMKIKTLERENAELETEITELQEKSAEIELREASRRETDEKKHAEDVAHYKAANEAHQAKLEEILCIPTK